jgi:hypothetical protein
MSQIKFTVKNIEENKGSFVIAPGETIPLIINVNEFNFPLGNNEEIKITKIIFSGKENQKIKDIIKNGKVYQMDFESSEVEDDRMPSMSATSGPAPTKLPNKIFLSNNLRVVYNNHNDSITIKESSVKEEKNPEIPKTPVDSKDKLIERHVQEIRDKLSAAGITFEQEVEILGNT